MITQFSPGVKMLFKWWMNTSEKHDNCTRTYMNIYNHTHYTYSIDMCETCSYSEKM